MSGVVFTDKDNWHTAPMTWMVAEAPKDPPADPGPPPWYPVPYVYREDCVCEACRTERLKRKVSG